MNVTQILQAIKDGDFSTEDLQAIQEVLNFRLKLDRMRRGFVAKDHLSPGQTVVLYGFTGKSARYNGITGILTKTKIKKGLVKITDNAYSNLSVGTEYNVPLSNIKAA